MFGRIDGYAISDFPDHETAPMQWSPLLIVPTRRLKPLKQFTLDESNDVTRSQSVSDEFHEIHPSLVKNRLLNETRKS